MAASNNPPPGHEWILEDEDVGVRHRMQNYYLPLFLAFCRARQLDPAHVRVLDCGCGDGLSVECMAEAGFQAFGLDLGPDRCQHWCARSRHLRAHLCQADATCLPFAEGAFDIVLSCGLLEHIGVAEGTAAGWVVPLPNQSAARRQFLAECLRVLRPGGVLYLDFPNGAFPIDFWHYPTSHNRPRFHWPGEKFLPTIGEVTEYVRALDPQCQLEALSPAGRFTFRRSRRHWYGKLLAAPVELYLELLRRVPFSRLAGTAANPFLVLEVRRHAS